MVKNHPVAASEIFFYWRHAYLGRTHHVISRLPFYMKINDSPVRKPEKGIPLVIKPAEVYHEIIRFHALYLLVNSGLAVPENTRLVVCHQADKVKNFRVGKISYRSHVINRDPGGRGKVCLYPFARLYGLVMDVPAVPAEINRVRRYCKKIKNNKNRHNRIFYIAGNFFTARAKKDRQPACQKRRE